MRKGRILALILWVCILAVVSVSFCVGRVSAEEEERPPWIKTIPYQDGQWGHPTIGVKFEALDSPSELIIDTGASISALDDATFDALKSLGLLIPMRSQSVTLGDGSTVIANFYRVLTPFSIGSCVYPVGVEIKWAHDAGNIGVVGQNVLRGMKAYAFNTVEMLFIFVCPFEFDAERSGQ